VAKERERERERELKGGMQEVEPERAIKYSYDAVWVFQHCVLCARTCVASFARAREDCACRAAARRMSRGLQEFVRLVLFNLMRVRVGMYRPKINGFVSECLSKLRTNGFARYL
jgi:hypothetical protein